MQLAFRDARAVGLRTMIEMPNTKPPIVDWKTFNERMNLVDKTAGEMGISPKELYVGIYGGVTNDLLQTRNMAVLAELSRRNAGRIKGLKIYCAHSTGDMGVTDTEKQRKFWREISYAGFQGVVVAHLEDECKYTGDFDSKNPISHSSRQNAESELSQAENQIKYASDAGFRGTLVSAHTSNPETVDYLISQRAKVPFKILIEMTAHHALLNVTDYKIHGNGVKMNPPLRSQELQERNLEHILRGNVDLFGSDHAPHDPAKKLDPNNSNPLSGIPAINAIPLLVAKLRECGITEGILQGFLFHNANRIFFDKNLVPKMVDVEYNPELWKAYGYNPFSRVERELGVAA
jgi:dihydroorotase